METTSRDGAILLSASVVVAVVAAIFQSNDATGITSEALISCAPTDRARLLGLDLLCTLWTNDTHHGSPPPPTTEETYDEAQTVLTPLLHSAVALFLLCGECVVLGAALFGSMVHSTPGVGLRATPRASFASALAIFSGVGYHFVCLSWCLGHIDLLQVVCVAPACQALLTAAVALLYAAVVDLLDTSNRLTISVAQTHRMARFC